MPDNPANRSDGNEILTLAEAADFLRISERTLYELAAAGQVPCTRVGRQYRFLRTLLRDHVARGGAK